MRMTPDVSENVIHAPEALPGTNCGIVVVRHCVEEWNALALLQDLVVRRGEEAVLESVSGTKLVA